MAEEPIFAQNARGKMKKRIKIQGILIFLALLLSFLLFKFLFPDWQKETMDEFLDALGIVVVLMGFLFRITARGYKVEYSREGRHLVTSGPYALMRNPMYFGTFLIGLGIILVTFRWWVFLVFLGIFLLIYLPQICKEENILAQRFGDEYKNYCRLTPRYLPRLLTLFKANLRDYLAFKFSWLKKELLPLVFTIALIIGIETWEDVRLFGYLEYKKELGELLLVVVSFSALAFLLYEKEDKARKN